MRELFRGDVRPYLGHNPIARMMVSILLILLVLQAVTGLVLAGTDIYYPPFGYWIASWVAAPGVDPATIAPYDKAGIDPTIMGGDALVPLIICDGSLLELLRTAVCDRHPYHRSGRDRVTRRRRHRLRYVYGAKGIRSETGGRCQGKLRIGPDSQKLRRRKEVEARPRGKT